MAFEEFWHCFYGRISVSKQDGIIRLLSDSGIETIEFDPDDLFDNSCRSGIVFFDNADPHLHDFLDKVSQKGLHRIIAVSIGRGLSGREIWNLLQSGAVDAFSLESSPDLGGEIAARLAHWAAIDEVLNSPRVSQNLIGQSAVWIKTLRQIINIAQIPDASILITGESGTGKELVARLVHTLDAKRGKNNLVVLDCAAIVPELSGSEFFGHERGAFTGAVTQREGAFALANNGTLFLDEVGELPMALQAELLRVIQEHTYKPVGGNSWKKTDFRLVCATNQNLLEQEERGDFRRDFYHRLATWTCQLPTLNDRVEDIPLLAEHFLAEIYNGKSPPLLEDVVTEYLTQRSYPGNVRELYHLIKRITYHHIGDGPITLGDVPEIDRPYSGSKMSKWNDDNFEQSIRRAILLGIKLKDITSTTEEMAESIAIIAANGKVASAAERLGIDKRTLQMHVKEYKDRLKDGNGRGPDVH